MSKDEQIIRKLNGHSGCEIDLRRSDDRYFVLKSSLSPAYGPRLLKQAEKQTRLAKLIPMPSVFDISHKDGVYSFKMDFVHGLDFKSTCLSRSISWINRFVEIMIMHLKSLESHSLNLQLSKPFRNKISSLQEVLFDHGSEKVRALAPKIDALYNYDFSVVPATENHGDMTLENIIFNSADEIFFIDALDGDLESFWLDLAKLTYDIDVSWSLRESLWKLHHSPEERLLSMLNRYLGDEMRLAISTHFPAVLPHLNALKCVQALRVVPYSHNEQTTNRLADYISNLTI